MTSHYNLSLRLGRELAKNNQKIAVAESCTGGGLASVITAVAGASHWFECGFVTYSNSAKHELLGVSNETLKQYGPASQEVAQEMAQGALLRSHADLSLSITGVAGPSSTVFCVPVGTVCFGIANHVGILKGCQCCFTGGRAHVCAASIAFALTWLIKMVSCADG